MSRLAWEQHNQVLTDTLMIADHFGKKHTTVMTNVKKAIKQLKEIHGSVWQPLDHGFILATYVDPNGKEKLCYYLNKDAFTFVARKYKGEEADRVFCKFIKDFNKGQQELDEQNLDIRVQQIINPIIKSVKDIVKEAVAEVITTKQQTITEEDTQEAIIAEDSKTEECTKEKCNPFCKQKKNESVETEKYNKDLKEKVKNATFNPFVRKKNKAPEVEVEIVYDPSIPLTIKNIYTQDDTYRKIRIAMRRMPRVDDIFDNSGAIKFGGAPFEDFLRCESWRQMNRKLLISAEHTIDSIEDEDILKRMGADIESYKSEIFDSYVEISSLIEEDPEAYEVYRSERMECMKNATNPFKRKEFNINININTRFGYGKAFYEFPEYPKTDVIARLHDCREDTAWIDCNSDFLYETMWSLHDLLEVLEIVTDSTDFVEFAHNCIETLHSSFDYATSIYSGEVQEHTLEDIEGMLDCAFKEYEKPIKDSDVTILDYMLSPDICRVLVRHWTFKDPDRKNEAIAYFDEFVLLYGLQLVSY